MKIIKLMARLYAGLMILLCIITSILLVADHNEYAFTKSTEFIVFAAITLSLSIAMGIVIVKSASE